MGDETYRLASLAEIGLLTAMKNYCWINDSVPSDKHQLARLLSLDAVQVEQAYGELIEERFRAHPHEAQRLFCPELEMQKQRISARRAKMSAGGKKGGKVTQAAARERKSSAGEASSPPSSPAKASELNRTELKREFSGTGNGIEKVGQTNEEWLRAYSSEEGAR